VQQLRNVAQGLRETKDLLEWQQKDQRDTPGQLNRHEATRSSTLNCTDSDT